MQNANNSGSGRGTDPRSIPKVMRMQMDSDSWIWIQDFLCGPQIRIGSVTSSGSIWATNSSYVRVTIIRHLVGTRECRPLSHLKTMVIPCGSGTPQTTSTIFYYHLTVIPLNSYGMEGHPFQPGPWVWRAPPECLDAWDRFYADKPEIFWRQIRIWWRYWDSYQIITEEIYIRTLAHSEQIHSARYVTDAFFWFAGIM